MVDWSHGGARAGAIEGLEFAREQFRTGDGWAPGRAMRISVRTVTGSRRALEVEWSDAVMQVKWQLERRLGCLVDEQRLSFAGTPMDDSRTLRDYGVPPGATVDLRVGGAFPVVFAIASGDDITMDVEPGDTAAVLKRKLVTTVGDLPGEPKFIFDGDLLHDATTVRECRFRRGCSVTVVMCRPASMQVYRVRQVANWRHRLCRRPLRRHGAHLDVSDC